MQKSNFTMFGVLIAWFDFVSIEAKMSFQKWGKCMFKVFECDGTMVDLVIIFALRLRPYFPSNIEIDNELDYFKFQIYR